MGVFGLTDATLGRSSKSTTMRVVKRSGAYEAVSFDKVTRRLNKLAGGLSVDALGLAQKIVAGLRDGVTTTELDELAAEMAAGLAGTHPDYGKFAARIAISNLHKSVPATFAVVARRLRDYKLRGEPAPLVTEKIATLAEEYADDIEEALDHTRDDNFDYFGFKTLERSYLLRIDGQVAERPQHLLMRVALGIHGGDIASAIATYRDTSRGFFTHASPTLFNAGTPRAALSSCFLLTTGDSIESIYSTLSECAAISKSAGGIGVAIHDVRAAGSYIRGTNGTSNGLVPVLRVFDATARYVDQGGGKRKGAFAMYVEPSHPDIFQFLDMRKNRGAEEMRARDLFYGLWIPDLFMKRVETDADWTLMCPDKCPGLSDVYGTEYEALYERYERDGRGNKTIKARELWSAIMDSQIETGTPYTLYKDAVNRHSNQKNLGTIRSSNLCCEVTEFTSDEETAVCNLASIAVNRFVRSEKSMETHERFVGSVGANSRYYDFAELHRVAKHVTHNLNKVIDVNYYPSEKARYSNMKNRPIGIGIQGLADAFAILGLPFDSRGAADLSRKISEVIYHAALEASNELAETLGPYESYEGSPVSEGILHHDSFGGKEDPELALDWVGLRSSIAKHGVRNSLLVAPMPTASTASIMGNNESFEAFTSNVYTRRVLSGEYVMANKHLMADLCELGIWSPAVKSELISANGSVQGIAAIPDKLKAIYKTQWEISGKTMIDLSVTRQAFVDQSQSFNCFMANPTHAKLTSYHFYAWKKGLKTGSYYIRIKAPSQAIKFTQDAKVVAPAAATKTKEEEDAIIACSLENPGACDMCSG